MPPANFAGFWRARSFRTKIKGFPGGKVGRRPPFLVVGVEGARHLLINNYPCLQVKFSQDYREGWGFGTY